MKLIQTIEKNNILLTNWGIYELDEEESKTCGNGKKFVVSQGLFSIYALTNNTTEELISKLREHNYEGIFETQKEAELHIQLVEKISKIERLESIINHFMNDINELKE